MPLNPVERRLAYLGQDWLAFCNEPRWRLLIWQVPANALRMVAAFFESQKYSSELSTTDLFIVFEVPFQHSIQYSRDVKAALAAQYAASLDTWQRQGERVDWAFDPAAFADSPEGVMAALRAFGSHHAQQIGTLAAVLQPESGADKPTFGSWLRRAIDANLPERLRLVVVEPIEEPFLATSPDLNDSRVARRTLDLDTFDIAQETFAQEVTTGPAGVFRNHLMALMTLVEKGTVDQVKAKARDALAFAQQQKWLDQEVVVRLLVAGALLKASRFEDAIAVYRASRQVAEQALAAAHPAGQKLILQTWFGEAGTLLAAGHNAAAADCYRQAAASAQLDRNLILTIEAHRMEAFCRALDGDRAAALACSRQALESGLQLKPEVRSMTSLPVAAMDWLRSLDPTTVSHIEQHKAQFDQALSANEAQVETRALAAGSDLDRASAEAIEKQLEAANQRTTAEAENALAQLLSEASPEFRTAFEQARNLLGADWPLIGSAAIFVPAA